MVQRWLTFVLDVTIAFLAVIIVTLAVTLKASGGLTGVALTQVLSLNLILTSIIIAWTALETSIDQHSDCEFIEALKKALLFDVISAQGGLDSEFQPSSLSHGQRQLFSLAGATLQKSKIVLLDEITGNVDQARDELMQKIVREEFELCSIIAIAHRLNTNMDFDRVIVLDGGHIVESGKPQDLLSKDFMFKQMWKGDTRHTEHE
ncbi:uncharacterized protein TERG_12651 [Trichophyton rubrum CBS 118892]|uniref:ABC transporter domain-containing protein n=1 Tax=Trichophyton rubrum (strain ATCC MYA-4607 / CBS 118892) TaxID=559305 RepID=A0A080WMF7_TRIRC|nr:uncharacterized protein TERG_12651 [Trichophyton rubrum CBS 118892]KFL62959.1 hypothetical protein TERG_12651 [Trichophyton rubrum CBS 118892]